MNDVDPSSNSRLSSARGAPAASTAPQWHVHVPPDTYGPYPLQQLRDFAQDGRLSADTLVWTDGDEAWGAAGAHPALTALFAAPPAAPPPAPQLAAASSAADADDGAPAGAQRGAVNVAALRALIAQRQAKDPRAASAGRAAPMNGRAMTFMESVQTCLQRQYAGFHGRARRSEYWWFALFLMLIAAVFETIAASLALATSTDGSMSILGILALSLAGLVMLAFMLPAIAVAVRRLHDLGWSGWWYLSILIPFVGGVAAIIMFIAFMMRGNDGPNKYGPDPLAGGEV
ncbi:MAG: DUF805 domain-containing protein [Roseiarcus sp.]